MTSKVAAALVCFLNAGIALFYLSPLRERPVWDFPQFYFAGRLVLEGKAAALYHPDAYTPLLNELRTFDARMTTHSVYFNRPPFEALALWPLALFSFGTAMKLALAANVALIGILVWKLPVWLRAPSRIRIWLPAFMPFLYTVAFGQDTLVLTILVAFALSQILRGRERTAGILFALAAFKPHLIWAVPIALAAARKWRSLYAFAATAGVLALVSFAMVGTGGIREWAALLAAPTTDVAPMMMGNVRALGLHFGPFAASAAAVAAIVLFAFALKTGQIGIALPAALAAGLMLSPHVYLQDYALLAIAAAAAQPLVRYAVLLPWPYLYPGRDIVPFILLALLCLAAAAAAKTSRDREGAVEGEALKHPLPAGPYPDWSEPSCSASRKSA